MSCSRRGTGMRVQLRIRQMGRVQLFMPNTRPGQPSRGILPGQGAVALFSEKRTIYHAPADLMMRYWVGEAAPELDHLRADAACGGGTSSSKYSAIRRQGCLSGPSRSVPGCGHWLAFVNRRAARGSGTRTRCCVVTSAGCGRNRVTGTGLISSCGGAGPGSSRDAGNVAGLASEAGGRDYRPASPQPISAPSRTTANPCWAAWPANTLPAA